MYKDTPAQRAQLKTELLTDPIAYGYANMSDSQKFDALNQIRDGSDGKPAISVHRDDVRGVEIAQAVDTKNDGNSAATVEQLDYLQAMIDSPQPFSLINPDGSDNKVMANLKQCFTNGSPSRAALNALSVRSGSRAEQLWGTSSTVSIDNVSAAENS